MVRTYSLSTFLNILHANTSDSPLVTPLVALLMNATGSFSCAAYRRAIRMTSPSPAYLSVRVGVCEKEREKVMRESGGESERESERGMKSLLRQMVMLTRRPNS